MKTIYFAAILCLAAFTGTGQIANPDFENWYLDSSAGHYKLYNWEHLSYDAGQPGSMLGTWVDSNAEHGLYALELSRWYGYVMDWVRQKSAISSRPGGLTGYYKYIGNVLNPPYNQDTALIEIFLTKSNTSAAGNDTIGSGRAKLSYNTAYTSFSCPVNYTDGRTPDSMIINIRPTTLKNNSGMCQDVSARCSYFTVDNLALSAPASVVYFEAVSASISPNPVKDRLVLSIGNQRSFSPLQLSIADALGKIVFQSRVLQPYTELDVSGIAPGNYFLLLKDGQGILQVKKLVKE